MSHQRDSGYIELAKVTCTISLIAHFSEPCDKKNGDILSQIISFSEQSGSGNGSETKVRLSSHDVV